MNNVNMGMHKQRTMLSYYNVKQLIILLCKLAKVFDITQVNMVSGHLNQKAF